MQVKVICIHRNILLRLFIMIMKSKIIVFRKYISLYSFEKILFLALDLFVHIESYSSQLRRTLYIYKYV